MSLALSALQLALHIAHINCTICKGPCILKGDFIMREKGGLLLAILLPNDKMVIIRIWTGLARLMERGAETTNDMVACSTHCKILRKILF